MRFDDQSRSEELYANTEHLNYSVHLSSLKSKNTSWLVSSYLLRKRAVFKKKCNEKIYIRCRVGDADFVADPVVGNAPVAGDVFQWHLDADPRVWWHE